MGLTVQDRQDHIRGVLSALIEIGVGIIAGREHRRSQLHHFLCHVGMEVQRDHDGKVRTGQLSKGCQKISFAVLTIAVYLRAVQRQTDTVDVLFHFFLFISIEDLARNVVIGLFCDRSGGNRIGIDGRDDLHIAALFKDLDECAQLGFAAAVAGHERLALRQIAAAVVVKRGDLLVEGVGFVFKLAD